MRVTKDSDLSVFDVIDNLQRLGTSAEILAGMRTALGPFGVECLVFNFLPDPTQNFEDVLLASSLPPGWVKVYNEREFVHDDPSIRYCRRMLRPFRWLKEAPYDPEREPRAIEVLHRAADFALLDGLVTPIADLGRPVGHVWAGGRRLDVADMALPAIHLIALYGFDRVLQLRRLLPSQEQNLTSRERDVLTWVAVGKTAWEIADLLGISSRTANAHITNARRKLGAVNRTQAVMIALRDQIIHP